MSDMELVSGYVPTEYIIWTVLVVIALTVIVVKYLPKVWKVFNTAREKVNEQECKDETLKKNTEDIEMLRKSIRQTIEETNARLSKIEHATMVQQKYIEDSREENELIINSLLGIVQGLQEVGANGPTKKAEAEIQQHLNKKSHETPQL